MRPVLANMGLVLQLAGIFIAFPIAMGFAYNETNALIALFVTGFAFFFSGFFLNAFSLREEIDFRQSCILLTGVFIVLGLIGAIPYFWLNVFGDTSTNDRILNSVFESVSGYTTTGFSLITNQDTLPRSLMFYRSFTHLVGGLGVVFILLAFFYTGKTLDNMTQVMNLMRVTDSLKKSLVAVLVVYTAYIFLFSGALYLLGFKDIANTVSIVLSSLMTGGFSPVIDFAPYSQFPGGIIVMLMMLFGATSFMVHYKILSGKFRHALTTEFWMFIIISAIGILAVQSAYPMPVLTTVFHVISASTGTGFSALSFSGMPDNAKMVFVVLMFIGGMSFSTAGGIKVLRLIIFFKSVPFAINSALGKNDESMYIDGHDYELKGIITNLAFVLMSVALVAGTTVLFQSAGFSLADSIFETTSAFGTVGLSSGIVSLGLASHLKIALILLMLIGRVEMIPFLVAVTKLRDKTSSRKDN